MKEKLIDLYLNCSEKKQTLIKTCLKIIFSPLLLVMGILTTLALIPLYPFLMGWIKGDGNELPSHSFLRYLWITLTMYFKS